MSRIKINLSVKLNKLSLPNPVMSASGTFGYGDELKNYININKLGAVVTKTLTIKPKIGNKPPRIAETCCGMLNSIGLENIGLDAFLKEKLPKLRFIKVPLIASIAGESCEDYAFLASSLCATKALTGVELNLSCPNIHIKNDVYGNSPEIVAETVRRVKESCKLAVIAKISPNTAQFINLVKSAQEAGADAVTVANTYVGMAVDIKTRRPKISNVTAGYSGPAIKPLTLKNVWLASKEVEIPVIASGGIMSAEDAVEFIIAGASAVEIGTANFINPRAALSVVEGIREYMEKSGVCDIKSLIGSIKC